MSRKIVSISEIPKSLTSNKGYEKEPTYDELINEIHTSKDKIQLPNRMMRRLRDSPQLMFYDDINAGELEEQHRNITANQMRDAEIRKFTAQTIHRQQEIDLHHHHHFLRLYHKMQIQKTRISTQKWMTH